MNKEQNLFRIPEQRKSPQFGWTIWFTGLSGAGKSTLSKALSGFLRGLSVDHEVIDGDDLRQDLFRELGFSKQDRCENIRRLGYIARLLNRHGVVSIVAAIAPFREARKEVRTKIPKFVEVHLDCSIEMLVQRDVKGLYKRALAGEIKQFTGISDPYEIPLSPELYLNSGLQSEKECLSRIIRRLSELGYLPEQNSGQTWSLNAPDRLSDTAHGDRAM